MKILIELENDLAELLKQQVREINREFRDNWTPETLAASLLAHVLIDSEETQSLQ